MGKALKFGTLALLGFCMQAANAQIWTKEPATVLGIKLGSPISESALPSCPKEVYTSKELCISEITNLANLGVSRLGGLPFSFALGSVFFEDGMVSSIHLSLSSSDFGKMREILVERYGQPTDSNEKKVTTRGGAVLSSETAFWGGVKISIMATERYQKIDNAIVIFSDNATADRKSKARAESIKSSASKL